MNTIQITAEDGTVINYTEGEVLRYIERAKEVDAVQQVCNMQSANIREIRNEVYNFFREGEWQDGETTCNKGDVNAMLERIGANKLTTTYTGTFIVTGTFSVEAEDADSATDLLTDNINVEFYDGDIDVDNIEIHDMEEDN
jgi:hypothetical protein